MRPHHPLFGRTVPVVEVWRKWGDRHFVIELPDGGHTRIPCSWASEELGEPEPGPIQGIRLSVGSARELIAATEALVERTRR